MCRVEALTAPHNRHHVGSAGILQAVRIPRGNVDNLQSFRGYRICIYFGCADSAKSDHPAAGHDEEFLDFHVVIVIALHNARFGYIHRDLSGAARTKRLCEAASCVRMHYKGILEVPFRQIGQERTIQLSFKRIVHLGKSQRDPAVSKAGQHLGERTQSNTIRFCDYAVAVCIDTFAAIQCVQKFLNNIVDERKV